MPVKASDSSGQPPVLHVYSDRAQMLQAVFALKSAAGRGLVQFGDRPQADGSSLAGFAVQIRPQLFRVVVFCGRDGGYTIADDFMASASGIDQEIAGVRQVSGAWVYTGYSEQVLLTRPVVAGGVVGGA